MTTTIGLSIALTIVVLMLIYQVNLNREDRKYHHEQIDDLLLQLKSQTIGEYAAVKTTLKPAKELSKKERKELESLRLREAQEEMDEIRVD